MSPSTFFTVSYESPVGWLRLQATDSALTALDFVANPLELEVGGEVNQVLEQTVTQLDEYFAGQRRDFNLPIEPTIGTPFQQEVWQTLQTIPYGTTWSYAQLADAVRRPTRFGDPAFLTAPRPTRVGAPPS